MVTICRPRRWSAPFLQLLDIVQDDDGLSFVLCIQWGEKSIEQQKKCNNFNILFATMCKVHNISAEWL